MDRVLWLGAGASAASEVSGWPRKPPTINHFFRIGQEIGLHQDEYFRRLFTFVQNRWGIGANALVAEEPQITIETLLSFFDTESQIYPVDENRLSRDTTYRDAYFEFQWCHDLLRNYVREVLFRSGAVPDHPRGSCPLHAAIASNLDPSDAVISFNYDLIMDKALADTGRWNEWAGYAPMIFNKIYDIGHWHTTMPSRHDFPRSSELVYFKLHGSINWFRSTGIRSAPQSAEIDRIEQDPEHPQQRVISLFSSQAAGRDLMNAEGLFEGQFCEQLLVPPTMHKNYEAFQPLWVRAEEVLAKAKELVIVGFSFAPADTQAQWLIHRGLARNPNTVSVILVDSDEVTRERIGNLILSINSRHQVAQKYGDFGKYVREQYGSADAQKEHEPAGV